MLGRRIVATIKSMDEPNMKTKELEFLLGVIRANTDCPCAIEIIASKFSIDDELTKKSLKYMLDTQKVIRRLAAEVTEAISRFNNMMYQYHKELPVLDRLIADFMENPIEDKLTFYDALMKGGEKAVQEWKLKHEAHTT